MRRGQLYRMAMIALVGLFGLGSTSAIALLTDAYWIRPVTIFVWREVGTNFECKGTVLRQAEISQSRIVDFASDAAVTINSYDYFNQSTVIGSALRQYFTSSGASSYVHEINRTGSPLAIRQNFVSQTAYKAGVPNIKEEGYLSGRHYWRVEIPVVQFRQSNAATNETRVLLTMMIVALRPSNANPNGIGIDSITATTLLNFDT